ncbi:polysaccharide deacetylase family protein [Aliiglaciecola sp. SL4]|uniref:polysaccharide deacetylase family protein n=1 Tax=Aliiglaciecola sp. SL4 TaxID=3239806 RepID=UPI00355BBC0B
MIKSKTSEKSNVKYYSIFLMLGGFLFLAFGKMANATPNHGVVLLYHHVSEDTPASTSISPAKFAEHMAYLKEQHNVIPLQTLIENIQNDQPLPENSVAITFDDGYRNIAENAHPIMLKYDFPYTIFISPDLIGKQKHQLNWSEINKLSKQGVSFANHTRFHKHLLLGNHQNDWLVNTIEDIEHAEKSIKRNTGFDLKYLAYPYGEYNQALSQGLQDRGYIGFGQQSGAISKNSDFGALPRFPAAGIYANLETLKVKMNTLDMPVLSKSVAEPQLSLAKRTPTQTVKVNLDDMHKSQLNCFYSGQPIKLDWEDNSFTYSIEDPLPKGRSRINCTAPSIAYTGKYYWFSQPWFVPDENGNWLD